VTERLNEVYSTTTAKVDPALHRGANPIARQGLNRSRIQTVIVAVITGNLQLAGAPGNVLLPARACALPRDSVINVSQLLTLDRAFLTDHASPLPPGLQTSVDAGLRLALEL
jgi:mRNA interferase MazF